MQNSTGGSSGNSVSKSFSLSVKIKAVKEVVENSRPIGEVASEIGCTRQALYLWIKTYKEAPHNAQNSLKNAYTSGKNHPKSISWKIERQILDLVIQEPGLGVDILKKRLFDLGINISTHGIYNILLRYGLHKKDLRFRFSLDHPIKSVFASALSPANRAKLLDEYLKGQKSISQVCRAWNISRPTFYEWLKRYKSVIDLNGESADAVGALVRNYKKGWQHHRACSENVGNVVKGIVLKNPEYSVRKIYKAVPVFNGRPIVGWHGIQNILAREDLNTFEKRQRFAQGYVEEQPQVQIAPLYIPQVPLYKLRHLIAHFATVPRLLLSDPKHTTPYAIVLLSSLLIFVLWLRLLVTTPDASPIGLFFASVALTFGIFFFIYSMKYYISSLLVLRLAQTGAGGGVQPQETGQAAENKPTSGFGSLLKVLARKTGLSRVTTLKANHLNVNLNDVELVIGKLPFVSIHVALYNEKRVVERLIKAAIAQDWYTESAGSKEANFEVIIADDSTDETTVIAKEILASEGRRLTRTFYDENLEIYTSVPVVSEDSGVRTLGPVVKLIHRASRSGFKGAALQKALENTEPRAAYVTIFDADFVPYPDTITQFIKTFQVLNVNGQSEMVQREGQTSMNQTQLTINDSKIAAVQGYQWHVLNKSQNWITRGVRTEYAGSYVIERAGEEIYGGLKQIAGSVYCIRADVLRQFGWGKSITEDFELTLRLYEAGWKVAFTPHIQAPAEAVSTLKRLIRQRMRWAEGASYNIKVMLPRILRSKQMTRAEKFEFAYLAPYYLQAAFFVVGTFAWFISEAVIGSRLPFWTAAFGWSLVFTNLFALPLMNIIGLFLEESEERDYIGILSFVALSYIVVPFQAYAAIKGFLETEEGPWFRTPKTGMITDTFGRSGFGKFFGDLFGPRPAKAATEVVNDTVSSISDTVSGMPISYLSRGSYKAEEDDSGPLINFKQTLRSLTSGSYLVAPAFVRKPKIPKKLFSRGAIAFLVIFSMSINYLAIFGKNVAQLPRSEDVQAEESGPTKLASINAAEAQEPATPLISEINVEKSVKMDGITDFIYEGHTDNDNLILFGRRIKTGDEVGDTGVIRIVSVTGNYVQYEIANLTLGPTKMSDKQIVFETSSSLINFKIEKSVLGIEANLYEETESGNVPVELELSMSEEVSMRRESEKGWQIVDDQSQETIFYNSQPKLVDAGESQARQLGDFVKVETKQNTYRFDLGPNADLGYPSTLKFQLKTNPANPVLNIADRRDNEAADYGFVVNMPKTKSEVGFNDKKTDSVGYKFTTGDKLYNMELKMKERSGKPSKIEGSKINWELGEMEAVYEVWTDKVKADYILKSKPAKNTIDFDFYGFSMIPVKNSDGSISFFGDDGYGESNNAEVFRLDAPNVKDASGKEGKISMDFSSSLNPIPLIPSHCQAKDASCKEPVGYYDRNGIVTLTVDEQFLNEAVYPVTIDPTTLDSSAASIATSYASQRHILATSDNDLVAFYVDSDSDIEASYSNDNGVTWSVLANVYVGTVDNMGAAIDSSNNVGISFSESTDVKYLKITNMITSNDIDGTWTVSSPVSLDTGTTPKRPTITIDTNAFPAVAWSFETTGGTKNSEIRFSRAVADPTTSTNWECATASSCGYVKNTDCTTDVCGDILEPAGAVNLIQHVSIEKAPSTAAKANELVLVWADSADELYFSVAEVNGANYLAWSTTTALTDGAQETNFDLSTLSVDDGTNQRIWVSYCGVFGNCGDGATALKLSHINADDNTFTATATGWSGTLNRSQPSLAYDDTNKDIYVFVTSTRAIDTDTGNLYFYRYNITAGSTTARQLFDIPVTADSTFLTYPNLKKDNLPTTAPGPKLDLIYTQNNGGVYTVFDHTWHTKETRNMNHGSLPTTEALTITSAQNEYSSFFDENEYTNSNSDDNVYVPASAQTLNVTTDYIIHTFKKVHSNNSDEIQVTWRGKTTNTAEGCNTTRACTLQIYEWGNGGACVAGWDTIATDTTAASGTEFALTATQSTNLSCYYSDTDADDHLGSKTVAIRSYKQFPSTAEADAFQTDVITFAFVPEKTLLLLPLAMFLPRIMRRFGWSWGGRKVRRANILQI